MNSSKRKPRKKKQIVHYRLNYDGFIVPLCERSKDGEEIVSADVLKISCAKCQNILVAHYENTAGNFFDT